MKNYFRKFKIIPLALAAGMLLNSCTKLDEQVYSELLAQDFVPTAKDFPSLIGPVYTNLRSFMGWQGQFDVEEESADIIVTPARPNGWVDGGTYDRMHKHIWTATQSQPNGVYSNAFNGINTSNRIIYQINAGEIPMTSGKDAALSELRAIRAYYYWLLLDNHGNVPIVTDYKDASLPKQSTRQQVYDFVVKELTEVIPQLTEVNDKTTYGRMNKWGAKALLARVYLNAGVYTGTPKWAECIAQCNDIITQATTKGTYALEDNYKDVFKTANENSKEIIFAIPYDENFASQWNMHMKTLDPLMQLVYPMQVQPWGGNCANPQWIDTYDAQDQRLKDTWIMGQQYNAVTGAPVINYVQTVYSMEKTASNEGFRIGKYEIKANALGALSNDFPVFRYADVLMMKAESLLRTGDAGGAATIVTQVRTRSFKANPIKATVTGAQLQQGSSYNYANWDKGAIVASSVQGGADVQFGRFLDELGWEFAAEGRRRTDIIRFGVFTSKRWFAHFTSSKEKTIFPIPQNTLQVNPNLKQNPGY